MALWLAKEFDWTAGRYTGNYYDIAEAGIVAVFVDSFYGDDTAAGTAAAPFKTLNKAITTLNSTGADGSRIFMNGIFSGTLPAQTYYYRFIGCGGGRNGRTTIYGGATPMQFNKLNTGIQGIETIEYNGGKIHEGGSGGGSTQVYFTGCILNNCYIGVREPGYVMYEDFYDCILNTVQIERGEWDGITIAATTLNGIRLTNCIAYNIYCIGVTAMRYILINSYMLQDIKATGGWLSYGTTNSLVNEDGQFINPEEGNFYVFETSPLLFNGSIDEITGLPKNIGNVKYGLQYNGIRPGFSESSGATITNLTMDDSGRYSIESGYTVGTLETATLDLSNIFPIVSIDLYSVFNLLAGEIIQGIFEDFSSPRMTLTIKLKYGLTSAEVTDCPWLLIEYGKQPTFSGTGASRVGNAADTFDPDNFQTITCRYMKFFLTLQNNS